MEAALCQAGLRSVRTGVFLLLFNAAFCRLFGHQQPCMHKPGLMSCPHVTNQCTSLRTLACNFILNSTSLFQSSTSSLSLTLWKPRPYISFREIKLTHCKALYMCLARRCMLGPPIPPLHLKPVRASQLQCQLCSPPVAPGVPHHGTSHY